MAKPSNPNTDLELHGRPELGSRFGNRAVLVVSSVAFLAVAVIIYGIFTREGGMGRAGDREAPAVTAAADAGKSMIKDAPEGQIGLRGLLDALQTERESRAKAEAEALAARNRQVPAMVAASGPAAAAKADDAATQALRQAMTADTGGGDFKGTGGGVAEHDAARSPAPGLPLAPPAGIAGDPKDDDQNQQAAKAAFLERAAGKVGNDALDGTRKLATSAFEIKASTVIPAVLLTGMNSDLPGNVVGQVSENVYDTASGKYLLIPQGSRLFGAYHSGVAYGQERALVAWDRLIFPDGSSLRLQGMGGTDKSGYGGFADQVNNHYLRLIGMAALSTVFAVAFHESQRSQGSVLQAPGAANVATAEAGRQLMELGTRITNKNLNIQPTIEIRPGYRFNVMVNKDMIFDHPYTSRPAKY